MTVTVEVVNQGSLNLLKDMAKMGLIHLYSSAKQDTVEAAQQAAAQQAAAQEDKPSWHRLRGIHANIPGASVDEFLARCYEDKEYELAIEKRQEEERARRAGLSS